MRQTKQRNTLKHAIDTRIVGFISKLNALTGRLTIRQQRLVMILAGLSTASFCLVTTLNSYYKPDTAFLNFHRLSTTQTDTLLLDRQSIEQLIVIGKMSGMIDGKPHSFFVATNYNGRLYTCLELLYTWRSSASSNGWLETSRDALSVYERDLHFTLSPIPTAP